MTPSTGIASNRDTRVPQANDIDFHVALENGLKTASLPERRPRSRPGPLRRKFRGKLATFCRVCGLTLARRSVQVRLTSPRGLARLGLRLPLAPRADGLGKRRSACGCLGQDTATINRSPMAAPNRDAGRAPCPPSRRTSGTAARMTGVGRPDDPGFGRVLPWQLE
jgi:hypothetical protein